MIRQRCRRQDVRWFREYVCKVRHQRRRSICIVSRLVPMVSALSMAMVAEAATAAATAVAADGAAYRCISSTVDEVGAAFKTFCILSLAAVSVMLHGHDYPVTASYDPSLQCTWYLL